MNLGELLDLPCIGTPAGWGNPEMSWGSDRVSACTPGKAREVAYVSVRWKKDGKPRELFIGGDTPAHTIAAAVIAYQNGRYGIPRDMVAKLFHEILCSLSEREDHRARRN